MSAMNPATILALPSGNEHRIGLSTASVRWRRLAWWMLAAGVSLLLIRWLALDTVVAFAAQLSSDGMISAANRARIASLLMECALWPLLLAGVGGLLSVDDMRRRIWQAVSMDRLAASVPNPVHVLYCTSAAGLAVMGIWVVNRWTPLDLSWLLAKEGPFELLTAVLLFASGLLCFSAARGQLTQPTRSGEHLVRIAYVTIGCALLFMAMEEISWGQTYLHWATPVDWAAINHQQETTIHNLVDQNTLDAVSLWVAWGVASLALIAILIGSRLEQPLMTAVAPHASTIVIVVAIGYGARLHLEVAELLFAIFGGAYAWRIYCATRRGTRGMCG